LIQKENHKVADNNFFALKLEKEQNISYQLTPFE